MTRAEKVAEAQRLRADGLLLREIAERMDAAVSTVGVWLEDPDLSRQRARRERYAGTCADCGAKTTGCNGAAQAPTRCAHCERHRNDKRNGRILEAWERGDSAMEIGRREGLTRNAVLNLVHYYRGEKGLPISRRARPRRELWPEIERLWKQGATGAEIAAALDTTPQNIYWMVHGMRLAGIDVPSRSPRKAAA